MMPSLSRSMLLHDWRRFLASAIALGFSAFLVYLQTGLALGMWFGTESGFLNSASADLWISNAKDVKSFVCRHEINKKNEFVLRLHPEVELLQTFWWSTGSCRTRAEGNPQAWVIPFDVNNNYLCVSKEFREEFGEKLEEPLSAVVDSNGAKALKLELGEDFEINGKRLKVVGFAHGYDGGRVPLVFVSDATFKYVMPTKNAERFDYLLVKVKDPSRSKAVRDELNALNGRTPEFIAWTKEDIYWLSLYFWMLNEDSYIWLFLVALSLIVGVAITNNSLRSALLASMREYAALRALGVSRFSLSMVVMKQSLTLGACGLALGGALAWGFSWIAKCNEMSFYLPFWLAASLSSLIVAATLISGLLALMVLYKTQPAELLR